MRDLYRCLDGYSPQLLQGVAEIWQIPLDKGEAREMALQLADAMLAPEALAAMVERLSADARSALTEILQAGGVLPGHRLSLKYGAIRRLGPARIERERPWLHPEGALEELYYSGIVYRSYGQTKDHFGETFAVPQQFFEPLNEMLSPDEPTLDIEPIPAPPRIEPGDNSLVEDIFATLARLRQQPISIAPGHDDDSILPARPPDLDLGPRMVGIADAERLDMIWHLLWRLRLVRGYRGTLYPGPQAREWLRTSDARRIRATYLAWRDDLRWNELCHVPTLRCEATGWQNNPIAARRNLSELLALCPANTWLSLDSFIAAIKEHRPDYARPDGDFDSWFIRHADTGEYLTGFASWDRVDGELARHLLTRPLYWLGVTDVGRDENKHATAFRLTDRGYALLRRVRRSEPAASDEREQEDTGAIEEPSAAEAKGTGPTAEVRDDFRVVIPLQETIYDRYQLERFAEWQEQDDQKAVYSITAESVWKSQDARIKIEQILSFLRRISREQASPVVLRTLQAWGGRFGRVFIRRQVVLQTADEKTMQQIIQQPELRPLMGEALSPTRRLVDEENVAEITRRLKEMGIWPHIRL
ncbi:MAG TPA: hypothetical protein GX702_02240 [Chloroflexi bacterium]|jgi:hypothetical protein|nr:hypothetical protein [Chloroflexota bacterium]